MSKTIVFFGSGPVAAKSLALLSQDFTVEAIVTKPTTKTEMSAVTSSPVLTVANREELDHLVANRIFKSQVAVLIDFGIIVSQHVIDAFSLGIVNSHFSLLPKLRGADPITFAILNGDSKTGVSLMLLDEKMDTGRLLTQKTFHIKPETATPELTESLIELSYALLRDWLPRYIDGEVKPRLQPHPNRASYTRKLTKDDGLIDLAKPAQQIEREIRAFAGWPKSRTTLGNIEVIITKGHVSQEPNAQELALKTSKDYLVVDQLKPAGKNEMSASEFLRGYGSRL